MYFDNLKSVLMILAPFMSIEFFFQWLSGPMILLKKIV